jgi:hypothetical protein
MGVGLRADVRFRSDADGEGNGPTVRRLDRRPGTAEGGRGWADKLRVRARQ